VLRRAGRWVAAQLAFLAVVGLLAVAFGYLVVEPGRWGRVSGLVAVAVLLAGLLRTVVPTAYVGLLAVRARWVDAVLYFALGGLILALDIRLHA
jgi:hypothetical protein